MACSLIPGERQPRRSKARIRMSRSDNPDMALLSRRHPISPNVPCPRRVLAGLDPGVRSPFVTRFRFLSFLTDYGLQDGFVAVCHGVAAPIGPRVAAIGAAHPVPPQ